MKKLTLVCDMDEVLTDLSDYIREIVNDEYETGFPKEYNKSYWWKDYGIPKEFFVKLLEREGLFYNLQPVEGAIEILNKLHSEGYDIHILTCPVHNRHCYYEKIEWIKNYLPFINIETNFHTTGNKGMFAKEDRVLIDDNLSYLQSFENNGGIAIAFSHPWNESYNGLRCDNWNDVYNCITRLYCSNGAGTSEFLQKDSMFDLNVFKKYMEGSHNE